MRSTRSSSCVNLLWCLPGAVGGSEEYLARQLVGLHEAAPEVHAKLFVLPGFAAAHRDLAAQHELVVASLDARRRSRRVLSEATWLPHRLTGVDVVHHGGGTVPLRSPGPIVLTVHDLQYRTYPEYLTASKRRYLQVVLPRSVHKADVVAVPSRYVRDTVAEAFGTDLARIVVVPHGVDEPGAWTDEASLRRRYHLGERRLLVYPAVTHPHKNHRLLFDLLAGPWDDPDLVLVLLGSAGPRRAGRRRVDRAPPSRSQGDPPWPRRATPTVTASSPPPTRWCSRPSTRASVLPCWRP